MNNFHFSLFVFFLTLGVILIQISIPSLAWICFTVALIVALHWFLKKARMHGEKAGKKVSDKISKEWKKIENSKGSYPKAKIWEESLQALGKKTAEGLMAKNGEKFQAPQPISRISKGLKNFIDGFNKIFGK